MKLGVIVILTALSLLDVMPCSNESRVREEARADEAQREAQRLSQGSEQQAEEQPAEE